MNKNILYLLTLLSITTAPLHASDLTNSFNELCKNHINFTNEHLSIALIGTVGVILTGIALNNLIARIYYPPKTTVPTPKPSAETTTKFTKQLPAPPITQIETATASSPINIKNQPTQTTTETTKSSLNQTPTKPLANAAKQNIEYADQMEQEFFTLFD